MRLFFVSALFFFAAVSWNLGDAFNPQIDLADEIRKSLEREKNRKAVDSLKGVILQDFPQPEVHAAFDSLSLHLKELNKNRLNGLSLNIATDAFTISNDTIRMGGKIVEQEDYFKLSSEELTEKIRPQSYLHGEDLYSSRDQSFQRPAIAWCSIFLTNFR